MQQMTIHLGFGQDFRSIWHPYGTKLPQDIIDQNLIPVKIESN